jgi:hypothetical protein
LGIYQIIDNQGIKVVKVETLSSIHSIKKSRRDGILVTNPAPLRLEIPKGCDFGNKNDSPALEIPKG